MTRHQLVLPFLLLTLVSMPAAAQSRPPVGVAFGGGGARGLAHVGVIKWLEAHHVPIDMTAGTSMGALVGGFFATGMPAAELEALLAEMDWNDVFASSGFRHRNVRRKADARAFPPRLEFGLKGGLHGPTSPNSGQQVGLLLDCVAAPYYAVATFDALPTPLRMVAVDSVTATTVVLGRGSLAAAMRASMSVPGIFPPVELDGRVLVDGGALNNLPADVVRDMGARHVIAVNVGDLSDLSKVDYSTFGLIGATLDAMVRANSRRTLEAADVVVNVPLREFPALDFRRSEDLIQQGYDAAEKMRDQLAPLAVSDAEWAQWVEHRRAARPAAAAPPSFLAARGLGDGDARRLDRLLAPHLGKPLDAAALERDLYHVSGLDRYESLSWQYTTNPAGEVGLEISAVDKRYAPPFLMFGLNLENTTTDHFRVSVSGRLLKFDLLRSGSELRLDATAGSNPGVAASLHTPLAGTAFAAPFASMTTQTFSLVDDSAVVAQDGQRRSEAGIELGVNLGSHSDVRIGGAVGHVDASVHVGNPGLPELKGRTLAAHAAWRLDTQDWPVVPTRGVLARATFRHLFEGPVSAGGDPGGRSNKGVSQLSGEAHRFWTVRDHHRLFALAGGGTSFGRDPQVVDRFELGSPMHLGAYNQGELAGSHYVVATAGYLRELTRLPEFLGGPMFAGAWLEAGDAFDDRRLATMRTHVSGGLVMDTLLGPVLLASSFGTGGEWRAYVSIGRMFR